MFKKIISLISVFVMIFIVSISASAQTIDTGIMTTDELYDYGVESVGTIVYPSWYNLSGAVANFPTSASNGGYTYNFDRYIIFLRYSAVSSDNNSDGSYKVGALLYDSSKFSAYATKNNSSWAYTVHLTDLSDLSRAGGFFYILDESTLTWELDEPVGSKSIRGLSYFLYTDTALLTQDETTTLFSSGVSSYYSAFLADDSNYSEGDLLYAPWETGSNTGGNTGSGGGFTVQEKLTLFSWLEKIWNSINSLASSIGSYFSDLGNYLGGKLDDIHDALTEENSDGTTGRNLFDLIADIVDSITSSVTDITTSIASNISKVVNSITTAASDIVGSISTMASDIISSITTMASDIVNSITTAVTNIINTIVTEVGKIIKTLTDFFVQVLDWFDDFFFNLVDRLIYLFVPGEHYFDNTMTTFKERLPFIGVVGGFMDNMYNYISTEQYAEAPSISVDLSMAEGKYNYGLGATALDLSWYGRYKPYVDMFLSAFLWIAYLWLLYKRLPDIISGAGMMTEMTAQFSGVNVERKQGEYRYNLRRGHRK